MTRVRYYEQDTPFGAWLREQGRNGNLPSSGHDTGITASDVDMMVQCYKNHHTGKAVPCLFFVEVKTRCATVGFAQSQIFSLLSLFACQRTYGNTKVRFYGVFRLLLSGTSPGDSERITWQGWEWKKDGPKNLLQEHDIFSKHIDAATLIEILKCNIHPCSLRPWRTERSHHGSKVTLEVEKRELFDVEVPVTKRY